MNVIIGRWAWEINKGTYDKDRGKAIVMLVDEQLPHEDYSLWMVTVERSRKDKTVAGCTSPVLEESNSNLFGT